MTSVISIAVLTAIFAFAADRWKYLKRRPVLLGLWFGIPALAANFSVGDISGLGIPVGLRDVPPIIAGFFFGPVAGMTAGAVSALGRVAMPLWGVGSVHWLRGALITLAVAGYAAALAPVLKRVITVAVNGNPRSMTAGALADVFKQYVPDTTSVAGYSEALRLAADGPDAMVCGSLYLAGAIRPLIKK